MIRRLLEELKDLVEAGGTQAKPKDSKRIAAMAKRAGYDQGKMLRPAQNMAKSIKDADKAERRGRAAEFENYHKVAAIFFARAKELRGPEIDPAGLHAAFVSEWGKFAGGYKTDDLRLVGVTAEKGGEAIGFHYVWRDSERLPASEARDVATYPLDDFWGAGPTDLLDKFGLKISKTSKPKVSRGDEEDEWLVEVVSELKGGMLPPRWRVQLKLH